MAQTHQTQILAKKYAYSLFEYITKSVGNNNKLPRLPYYINNKVKSSKNEINLIFEDIRTLQYLLITNQELNNLFLNPGCSVESKLEILRLVLPKLNPVLQAFLQVLADRNQLSLLEITFEIFNTIYNDSTGLKHIKVITRVPLIKEQKARLRQFLDKKSCSQFVSSKVNIDYIISDKVLGGIIIVDGFSIIDNSLQNKVQNLLKML